MYYRSTVSRALCELEAKDIVECITPDEVQSRFYDLTETGRKVRTILEEMQDT